MNLFNLIVGICGIIAIPLAFYFYVKTTRLKKPCYSVSSYSIVRGIGGSHPGLKLYFDGYGPAIDSFTVSKLLFLNVGRQEIQKTDIPAKAPLEFHLLGEGTILSAEVIQRSKEANNVSINVHKAKIDPGVSGITETPGEKPETRIESESHSITSMKVMVLLSKSSIRQSKIRVLSCRAT